MTTSPKKEMVITKFACGEFLEEAMDYIALDLGCEVRDLQDSGDMHDESHPEDKDHPEWLFLSTELIERLKAARRKKQYVSNN